MANAQKMIEERKKALLQALNKTAIQPSSTPAAAAASAAAAAVAASIAAKTGAKLGTNNVTGVPGLITKGTLSDEKSRKIAMLQVT